MTYTPPLADMRLAMQTAGGLDGVLALPGFQETTPDLVDAILDEGAKLAHDVLAPINRNGDTRGAELVNGVVRTSEGFKDAYAQFAAGGWGGAPFAPEHGGQGLPWLVGTALGEMWASANMAFALCPLLTQGAIELLEAHGSPAQKETYLTKMVSGTWTGTMNLTEPQAGSDVGALRTRAVPEGDHYRITGQKIFITWGDHDVAENVVHMVLARLPDAPAGTGGVSLFIVPKFLPDADGNPGPRNDLRAASLEHKLGIHGSPTCVMAYGDDGGAIGYLVGEANRGIQYMFTMMNNARLGVGLEGVAIAERAYQQARDFAKERVQGRDAIAGGREPVPIIRHPDVRRMLLDMKARTEAVRALAYYAAGQLDRSRREAAPEARTAAQARVDLLIPMVKAYCTDIGVQVASTGVQVHGGMGFIEETGAAQHYRDARIAPIYEGTNGIQALDLMGRKLQRDGGAAMRDLCDDIAAEVPALARFAPGLGDAVAAVRRSADWLATAEDFGTAASAATPFLELVATTVSAWLLARGAAGAGGELAAAKLITSRYYASQVLPRAVAIAATLAEAGDTVMALDETQF